MNLSKNSKKIVKEKKEVTVKKKSRKADNKRAQIAMCLENKSLQELKNPEAMSKCL